ncbi:MAG: hypothetical protein ABR611_12040 [Chthoniobacterales bacterium]
MSDPRNAAHGKKVAQEKHHEQMKNAAGGKTKSRKEKQPASADNQPPDPAMPEAVKAAPGELEKSVAVLSKLKDLEFHSRANIEALAELTLTIEDELKQKDFVEPIGALYSMQDGFHSKIAALIESYEAKCESLKQPS